MKTNRRVPASGAATPRKRAQRILKHPCPQSEVLRRGTNNSPTGTRLPRLAASWAGPLLRKSGWTPRLSAACRNTSPTSEDVRTPPLAESRTSSRSSPLDSATERTSDSMRCHPSSRTGTSTWRISMVNVTDSGTTIPTFGEQANSPMVQEKSSGRSPSFQSCSMRKASSANPAAGSRRPCMGLAA